MVPGIYKQYSKFELIFMSDLIYKNNLKNDIIKGTLTILLIFTVGEMLILLFRSWVRLGEYWRFGIIPVSLYLIKLNWNKLSTLPLSMNPIIGYPVLFLACVLLIIWKITLFDFFLELAFLALINGLIIFIFGIRVYFSILLPLFYIIFATSIFSRLFPPSFISFLQKSSAILSAWGMNLFGWTVLRDGLFIQLSGAVLEVEKVCSGVNQLSALFAIAIPFAYVSLNKSILKIILILATLPISIIFNSARIFLIGIWNYHELKSHVHGPYDILLIPVIYPFAILTLILMLKFLNRFDSKNTNSEIGKIAVNRNYFINIFNRKHQISLTVLFSLTFLIPFTLTLNISSNNINFDNIPINIDTWKGYENIHNIKKYNYGNPDFQLNRFYVNEEGDTIFIHMGHFKNQTVWKKAFSFKKYWALNDYSEDLFKVNGSKSVMVNSSVIMHNDTVELAWHWYMIDGEIYTKKNKIKKVLIQNLLSRKGNSISFVSVSIKRKRYELNRMEEQVEVDKLKEIMTSFLLKAQIIYSNI